MAMCWITRVSNFHSTGTLRFMSIDSRRPRIRIGDKFRELPSGEWFTVDPGTSIETDNFAVPWNMGKDQALWVSWTVGQRMNKVQFDIIPIDAWDYLRIRDSEYREIRRDEVGSMGDASGSNYSYWKLVLHSDGTLGMYCDLRQGLTREGAEIFANTILKILEIGGTIAAEVVKGG